MSGLIAALFTPSVSACGATVDVESSPVRGFPISDAGPSLDAGLSRMARECGTTQGSSPCGAAEVVNCGDLGQQLVTRIEPLDCNITRGLTGDPEEQITGCQAAFSGQSGDGCSAEFSCVRRTLVGCCLELAACHGDEPSLLRSRACAESCPAVSSTLEQGLVFEDCGGLLRTLGRLDDPFRVQGAPCRGDFVCSQELGTISERELPFVSELEIYFCVGQQVQVLNALSWFSVPLPGVDAGTSSDDAGDADASVLDAGRADAGAADAGAPDAGAPDGEATDAGPAPDADAGIIGP